MVETTASEMESVVERTCGKTRMLEFKAVSLAHGEAAPSWAHADPSMTGLNGFCLGTTAKCIWQIRGSRDRLYDRAAMRRHRIALSCLARQELELGASPVRLLHRDSQRPSCG